MTIVLVQSLLLAAAALMVLVSCWINFQNTTLMVRELTELRRMRSTNVTVPENHPDGGNKATRILATSPADAVGRGEP